MAPAKQKSTIIITGANGFVGSELIQHFKKKGWDVIALVRNPGGSKIAGVQYVAYDLTRPFDDTVFKSVDYLVHAAYIKYNKNTPDAMKLNIDGAKRLMAAAKKYNLKKCVFMSSMSAHSDAESVYGKQKLAIEKIFTGKDCAVIRSGLIIGNGGIVKQMVGFMRSKHVVPLVGGGSQPLQVISVHDLINVIDKLLTTKHSGTFTIATPEIYTYKEFYKAISEEIDTRVIFIPVPFFVLLGTLQLIAFLHIPLAVSSDNALGLKHLRAVDNSQDLQTLGVSIDPLSVALAKEHINSSK